MKVEENEISMEMYKRYIDDSNQILLIKDGCNPESQVEKILDIANSIEEGIVMEVDNCTSNEDQKLPILDTKCWLDDEGFAVYQHYEKPVATKLVISSRSAHANG